MSKPRSINTRDVYPITRGPDGNKVCCVCHGELPSQRRTYCSETCWHAARMRCDAGYWRDEVIKAANGVCRRCGFRAWDFLEAIQEIGWRKLHFAPSLGGFIGSPDLGALIGAVKTAAYRSLAMRGWDNPRGSLLTAHHIVPVAQGGPNTLENGLCLCVPCHKNEHAAKPKPVDLSMPLFEGAKHE